MTGTISCTRSFCHAPNFLDQYASPSSEPEALTIDSIYNQLQCAIGDGFSFSGIELSSVDEWGGRLMPIRIWLNMALNLQSSMKGNPGLFSQTESESQGGLVEIE